MSPDCTDRNWHSTLERQPNTPGNLRPLVRKTPFQQEGDANSDSNKGPNEKIADVSYAQFREQEDDSSKKEQRASDSAMKAPISKPIGNAADRHAKKNGSGS